ncbi:hypothetical protein E2C01_016590 [Portunus trituberculatus]|uniref:Uncharacterized protein n=1 Tax=Portunus trituberculatus TaxID=210409 RepID=A0A5B7DQM4_PORTR|nr:hypothetical protein [Portunus trituberculatus]
MCRCTKGDMRVKEVRESAVKRGKPLRLTGAVKKAMLVNRVKGVAQGVVNRGLLVQKDTRQAGFEARLRSKDDSHIPRNSPWQHSTIF